ncbi:ATP-dependent nuclease [Leifsonia sp. 22587]|uniref:ATP-dependent nuclease n=1 Tax=Leifsonia sp. 22587 TaxID=3453946 RepID=UPI003F85958B
MLNVKINTFETSDGTQVSVPDAGVVIFVGPNNAGKSQALRDLVGKVRNGDGYVGKAITAVSLEKQGDTSELWSWAQENLPRATREGVERIQVSGWGDVAATDVGPQWSMPSNLGMLTDSFVLFADGKTRLTSVDAPTNIDFRTQFPTHPIQRAARDSALEVEFSEVSRSAFGLEATVDRFAGAVIPLRLGPRPVFAHENGVPTMEYLEALAGTPAVENQGDGVKSFLGLMTQLIAGSHTVLLVDEPEAFLHPPQARLLGRLLAQRASSRQVFLATHSADIVQGALEAGASVTIVRLTREADLNRAAVIDDADVQELWADPLLRYSDVLDGLFHDAVVLCESDSDCRYYAAVRNHLFPDDTGATRRPELHFTHCGGKGRLAVVIRALKAVRVPVVVVSDFDLLREEADVRKTVEALGGQWEGLSPARSVIDAALKSDTKPLRKTATKDALISRLDSAGEVLNESDIDALRSILKADSGWDKAKRAGLAGLPQGDPSKAAEELLVSFTALGLLVVPVGELERFVPTVGGHGPGWVNGVLSEKLHEAPSADAEAFVTSIDEASRRLSGLVSE